jgi:hypothetical protein
VTDRDACEVGTLTELCDVVRVLDRFPTIRYQVTTRWEPNPFGSRPTIVWTVTLADDGDAGVREPSRSPLTPLIDRMTATVNSISATVHDISATLTDPTFTAAFDVVGGVS